MGKSSNERKAMTWCIIGKLFIKLVKEKGFSKQDVYDMLGVLKYGKYKSKVKGTKKLVKYKRNKCSKRLKKSEKFVDLGVNVVDFKDVFGFTEKQLDELFSSNAFRVNKRD